MTKFLYTNKIARRANGHAHRHTHVRARRERERETMLPYIKVRNNETLAADFLQAYNITQ